MIFTSHHGPAVADRKLNGVIGTVLLFHFLATLDYPAGELTLRRATPEAVKQLEKRARTAKHIEIPFWMSGDHYMVAWGRVNQAAPALLFVDTGFNGGGFLCPDSTIKEARIPVQATAGEDGKFPAGSAFEVEALALGEARNQRIKGKTGVFPPQLENVFGFRIAGLVSHQFFRPFAVTFDCLRRSTANLEQAIPLLVSETTAARATV